MADNNKGNLPDKKKDADKLKSEESILDLPEIGDIEGQENVKPPEGVGVENLDIASGDEEGEGVLDEKQEEVLATDNRSDVTPQEQRQLAETETMQTDDDRNIQKARLDNEDFEGEPLNESIRQDGKDL